MTFVTARSETVSRTDNRFEIMLHILIWSALMLLPYTASSAQSGYRLAEVPAWFFNVSGLMHAGIFYGNSHLFAPSLLNKRTWPIYLLTISAVIFFSVQLKFMILQAWAPESLHDSDTFRYVVPPTILVLAISLVYRVVAEKSEGEREQLLRREEQLQARLKLLRSQMSPHFLFNAFTSLAYLARKKSVNLENAIIMLADITRYMHFNSGENATIENEIMCLGNYVELQKIRFANHIDVQYDVQADSMQQDLRIEPMILLPFVENAFKHGTDCHGSSWIRITLTLHENTLMFVVENTFLRQQLPCAGNATMGLHNVEARLKLLYPDSHNLTIREVNNIFRVQLTVFLKPCKL